MKNLICYQEGVYRFVGAASVGSPNINIQTSGFQGQGTIEKTGTVVNLSVWDMTLVDEARKWIHSQLKKKRRVFQCTDDPTDFYLFSTNVPSLEKLKILISKKFKSFNGTPSLKEITNSDEFESPALDLDDEEDLEKEASVTVSYDGDSMRPRR